MNTSFCTATYRVLVHKRTPAIQFSILCLLPLHLIGNILRLFVRIFVSGSYQVKNSRCYIKFGTRFSRVCHVYSVLECEICPGCRQPGQKTVEAGCAFPGPDHVLSAGWGWCGVLLFRLLMLPPSHTLILLFRER